MSEQIEKRRTRRSRSEWEELVVEQAASGLSQRAFCEARDLSVSAFGYHRRRLRKSVEGNGTAERDDFVAIPLTGGADPRIEVELQLSAGVVLRIRGG